MSAKAPRTRREGGTLFLEEAYVREGKAAGQGNRRKGGSQTSSQLSLRSGVPVSCTGIALRFEENLAERSVLLPHRNVIC